MTGPGGWPAGTVQHRNHATRDVLLAHLRSCDLAFIPPLSSRVDLEAYADRLMEHAERIEAWHPGPVGERLVGLVAIYCNNVGSTDAFISSVSVEAAHRGSGLGRAMLEAALQHARAAGFDNVSLKVNVEAVAARRAYTRLGFSETGREGAELTLRRTLRE